MHVIGEVQTFRYAILKGTMIIEAKVLKAISETMTCEKCPYPCNAKEHSSQANCVMHWSEILSQINLDEDWKEIRHKVFEMF